jgi:hypothetical protein
MLQFAFSHFNFSLSREISQFITSSSIYLFSFNPKSSLKFCNPKSIYLLNFLYSLFLFLYSLFFDFFFDLSKKKDVYIFFPDLSKKRWRMSDFWVCKGERGRLIYGLVMLSLEKDLRMGGIRRLMVVRWWCGSGDGNGRSLIGFGGGEPFFLCFFFALFASISFWFCFWTDSMCF